ncbi:MAG: TrmB family transcriptional regulator [Candidatus Moranbacteria bacterium]|nr:TrmB family transcriptional regulator [Candidatus Moranbacteria bacterium]
MEKLDERLEKLGITGKEAEVYIELLKLREASVAQLSKNTKIKRTSVYYCLDALMKKEIVGQVDKNGKKFYFCEDPKRSLNNLVEQQKLAIEEMLPQIKDILGKGSSLPTIKIYYNVNGLRNLFADILFCKEKVARYYMTDTSINDLLGMTFMRATIKKRVAEKIKALSLRTFEYNLDLTEELFYSSKFLRETRFLPKDLKISPYMIIYDNKSIIIAPKEKIGFIVESQEFADAQKAIFDIIWNISENNKLIGGEGQVSQKATEEDLYY